MSAKKLAQQKAGPMSPVSEETKADSIGLPNRKGTVKTTLETLRRLQRQTAKALSLVGTASITGMGLAGLLLAPFPVPTTFSQAQGTDEPALPAPPVPVPNKLYIDGFPELDDEDNFNMSVRFTNPQWTWPCYYWTGIHNDHQWRTTHNYRNYLNNTFYYPGRYDYWICKIVMEGDNVHYSASSDDWSHAEVWFWPGELRNGGYFEPSAWVQDSDNNWYSIPVSVNGHEFDSRGGWQSGDPPWHSY